MNNSQPPYGYRTQVSTVWYTDQHKDDTFIPSEYADVNGYKCVHVSPNSGAYFYRVDKRLPFTGSKNSPEKASIVFGTNRNTYFGIEPTKLISQYKTHTHLYVVKPNTSIMLINMNEVENVRKLMETPDENIRTSIQKAFKINNNLVERHSDQPSKEDPIDHDRVVLKHICSIPGIDGYYVSVGPLHPEIGFCEKSLDKLNVIGMFRANPDVVEKTSRNNTRKRSFIPLGINSPLSKALFSNKINNNSNNNNIPRPKRIFFGGGKRKQRKTHKKRQTHRK